MTWSTSVCCGLVTAVTFFVSASIARGDDLTHLNVTSRRIVNVSTYCLPNDNSGDHPFYYDRQKQQFDPVPRGWSFVITDIIITMCHAEPNQTDRFGVVVEVLDGRAFTAGFVGALTQHYHLTGGLVVPEEKWIVGRNTTSSSSSVNVQLLGYFVRGPGLGLGVPFPFPSAGTP